MNTNDPAVLEETPSTPWTRAEAALAPYWERGVPRYMDDDLDAPEGLYIALFHGFLNEEDRQEAEDWGVTGPMIGPLQFVQTTYNSRQRFEWARDAGEDRLAKLYGCRPYDNDFPGPDFPLSEAGDCIVFGGVEFGDYTIFYHRPGQR